MLNITVRRRRSHRERTRSLVLTPDESRSNRGSALVGVMGITTAVLLVGVAIFTLGYSESDIVDYAVDDARAFYVAEGGLERTRGWLGELAKVDPGANPVGRAFADQRLGGGTYTATVVNDASGGGWIGAYEVVSTGEVDGVVRQVKSTMVAETFARYQWLIESGGGDYSWFRTGERFGGPVHVNGSIMIDGDPWFGGFVRASGGITLTAGSNPVFERGYQLNVGQLELPSQAHVHATLRAEALEPGGHFADALPNKRYYTVELGRPSAGYVWYRKTKENGHQVGAPTTVDISSTNGAFWFDAPIEISGVVDGELTIGVDGDIIITDDILYFDSSPGGGPNPDCDDVLGLIAAGHPDGDIIIERNPANNNDCEIHGVLMALQKNIEAEDYQHGGLRGNLIVWGGTVVEHAIHIAEYTDGVVSSGYLRDFHYDPRLITMPPPYFPYTGTYIIAGWGEVVPPQIES
ncbi:DUF4900 domain-containing protein [bacterium]|nr:DUF4900 domain-containing protein [bacterium]